MACRLTSLVQPYLQRSVCFARSRAPGKRRKNMSHSQRRQTDLKEGLRKSSAAVEGSAHSRLKLCTALPCGDRWRGISAAIPSARLMPEYPLALSSPRCHSDFRHQGFFKQCKDKDGGDGRWGEVWSREKSPLPRSVLSWPINPLPGERCRPRPPLPLTRAEISPPTLGGPSHLPDKMPCSLHL